MSLTLPMGDDSGRDGAGLRGGMSSLGGSKWSSPSKTADIGIQGTLKFVAAAGGVVFINKESPSRIFSKQYLNDKEEERSIDASCYSHSPPDMPLAHYNNYRERNFRNDLHRIWKKVEKAKQMREDQFKKLHGRLKDSEALQDSSSESTTGSSHSSSTFCCGTFHGPSQSHLLGFRMLG